MADFKVCLPLVLNIALLIFFQLKNSLKKGLFHPNDLKTIGLGSIESSPYSPSPLNISKRTSPPTKHTMSHSRASSLSGSIGRSDARRTLSGSSDLERYTENEDEDYEDVFVKPSGSGKDLALFCFVHIRNLIGHIVLEEPETLQLTTRLSNKSWVL